MSESYNQLFDEQDLLEENNYQWVFTGKEKKSPYHKVLIHKFKKSKDFDEVFKELIDTLQNKYHIEETEEFIILVTKDLEGDNISLHLNFSNTTTEERFDYLYEYLHQSLAYISFDPYLFNVLISSNQVVFINDKLFLREKIVLDKKMDTDFTFSRVAKTLGQVMQRILITNFNDLSTSLKYDHFYSFTESLIRREKKYQCFDDLFNDFKAIYFGKSSLKPQVLLGDHHPNNMFIESLPETKELPSSEVTDEERALLTGFNYKEPLKVEDIEDEAEEENDIDETPSFQPHSGDGPFEESLDLSKLTGGNQSLEELFVRERPIVKKTAVPKETVKETLKITEKTSFSEATNKDNSLDEETSFNVDEDKQEDTPKFGIPGYMKEEKPVTEVKKRKKRNFNVHWSLPVILLLTLLLIGGSIYGVVKFINRPDEVSKPPEAKFEASFEGNTLVCTNLSTASNGAYITESLWVISKDGVEIEQRSGVNKAGFKVTGLTEGTYSIELTVTDSNNHFSDPYLVEKEYLSNESKALENKTLSEAVYLEKNASLYETLDDFSISASTNVIENKEKYHSGAYAYNIDTSETQGMISFNGLDVEAGSTLSFWILNEDDSPVEIQISGFKNGKSNFDKTLVAKTDEPFKWKVVSVQLNLNESTDNIIMKFPKGQSLIAFDDLSIRTFK